jgi:hypothetical protein
MEYPVGTTLITLWNSGSYPPEVVTFLKGENGWNSLALSGDRMPSLANVSDQGARMILNGTSMDLLDILIPDELVAIFSD